VSTNKARGGSEIIKKNRNKIRVQKSRERRPIEYSTIGCKVATTFIIIFGMCKREGI